MKSSRTFLGALCLLMTGGVQAQSAEEFYDQGARHAAQGRLQEAAEAFEQALQADPLDFSSTTALAVLADARSGRIDEATVVHLFKAFEVANAGDWEQAMSEADQAIAGNPDYGKAWSSRGNIHALQAHYDDAIADYSKAIEVDPDDAEAYHSRGAMHNLSGNHDLAIADYTRAIEQNPRYAMSWFGRGIVFANDKKDYDRALADFAEALKIDPRFEEVYLNRGLIHAYVKQDMARAVADFDKALEINPELIAVHLNKAAAYEQAGRTDDAIAAYEAYMEQAPAEEAATVEQARQRVGELRNPAAPD